jgi:transcriptional regulator with XRE-family HTH domain
VTFKRRYYDMLDSSSKSNITLKDLRIKAGLTQRQIAILLDMRVNTIGEWERGITEPRIPIRKVLLLCKTLNCTLEELIECLDNTALTTEDMRELVAS